MLIAQLTDLHIGPPEDKVERLYGTSEALGRAVGHLVALAPRPDCLILTGDLVERGSAVEYGRLRQLLAPLAAIPTYAIPGNHDHRANLKTAFPEVAARAGAGPFVCYAVDDWELRLIALDTQVPGEDRGALCPERLGWLDRTLAARPRTPTVVLMHHPPFRTGIAMFDAPGLTLEGAAVFARILARHPQVERVVCGHVHRPIAARIGGVPASVAPSTAHQYQLAFEGRAYAVAEPPSLDLHLWRNGTLISHRSYIGAFPVLNAP